MAKLAYALYDEHEMKLSQFTADAVILAKDAVSAFLVEKVFPASGTDEEIVKDILTEISGTKDVQQLLIVLNSYDFQLALMPV